MTRSILNKHKVIFLTAGFVIFLSIAYQFAFVKTIEAFKLNKKLNDRQKSNTTLQYNPEYSIRKNRTLNGILKTYQVDSVKYNDQFWLSVSGAVSYKNVELMYDAIKNHSIPTDSTGILRKNIQFKGDFADLVALLHTIEGKPGIGKTSSIQLKADKNEQQDKILLMMDFAAIAK